LFVGVAECGVRILVRMKTTKMVIEMFVVFIIGAVVTMATAAEVVGC
jgi:hypothetical protein